MIDRLPMVGTISGVFERRWLVALLAADGLLIGAHIYFGATSTIPRALNLSIDRNIAEFYGYFELGLAAILLVWTFTKVGEPIMLACAAMLACIMADDILGVHEVGGWLLSAILKFPEARWLKGHEFGELLVWAILAGLILPLLIEGLRRTPQHRWYRVSGLFLLTGVLAIFAVVFDVGHEAACVSNGGYSLCSRLMHLIEDGGEKATMSLILAHVVYLARNPSATALFDLTQRLRPDRIGVRQRSSCGREAATMVAPEWPDN